MDIPVNYFALFVAGFVAVGLGFLWYSPFVFGKKWVKASGMSAEKIAQGKKRMPLGIIGGFLCQLVIGYVLIQFAEAFLAVTASDALQLAFLAWLGFLAVPSLHAVFWEGKPVAYWAINVGYQLAVFGVMALILVLWR